MLSKEIKDILEGIHFFLTDGLKHESLSGKAECMRRGLLLQLEGLRIPYPFLHFTSTVEPNANIRHASNSLSYLNVEHPNVNSSRMSTSSSSSTNYSSTGGSNGSSTGYSGDGVVTGQNQNTTLIGDKKQESCEEFEDIETCSQLTATQSRRSSADLHRNDNPDERDDEFYAEDIEHIPFRILVGKCDYHGVLSKRSKGLLPGMKNSKSFRCVLSGHLLYLYLKESDDKQKKVIDLGGYHVQEAPMDENKLNSRRRDFAFQLIGPGKKTHIFFTSKKTSMERWINSIKRAISCSGSSQGVSLLQKKQLTKVEEDFSQDFTSEHEDEDDQEFYEELNLEEEVREDDSSSPAQSSLWKPPLLPYHTNSLQHHSDDTSSEYYSVPEGEETTPPIAKPNYCNQQKQRIPPERPPLPNILLHKNLHPTRPLPKAPETDYEGPETMADDEIYCEIDDALMDGTTTTTTTTFQDDSKCDNFSESMNNLLISGSSLSKEIFDTINERVPSLPARTYNRKWNEVSFRSDVSTDAENYDVPTDVTVARSHPSWGMINESTNPPSLPPKGKTFLALSDEESEYKVPSSTACAESLYHVPCANPVPVEITDDRLSLSNYDKVDIKIQEPVEEVADEKLSDCVNNNRDSREEEKEEEEEVLKVSGEDTKSETNAGRVVVETEDKMCPNPSTTTEIEEKTGEKMVKINSSNSVKDLIAKLNQNDELTDTNFQHLGGNNNNNNNNNNLRRSKHNLTPTTIRVDKAFLVENKTKIELSRSVKSIKIDLENKDKLKLELKETKDEIEKQNDEQFHAIDKEETPFVHRTHNECLYQNCDQETNDCEGTRESPDIYIAKFAFVSTTAEGLSFNRGDEVLVKECPSEDRLWKGVIKGREGLVPREYLRRKH